MLTEVVPLEVIGISRCLVVSCFMVWLVRFRRSDENMFLFSVFLLFPLLRSEIGVIECVQVVMVVVTESLEKRKHSLTNNIFFLGQKLTDN